MSQAGLLEREIFGSDSDLSSEDENQGPRRQPKKPQRYPSPAAPADQSNSDSEGEYQEEPRKPTSSKKKRRASTRDVDDGRPTARRKSKKKAVVEDLPLDNLPELSLEEQKRVDLNQRIDSIVKPSKGKTKKRKKAADEDDLDQAADAEVSRVKHAMEVAALEDTEAIKTGRPAVAKLKMLNEVTETLQKTAFNQSIIDQNLLEAVRAWLEPLPDKSLPALNIQRAFFETLGKMFIDTNTLKDSGLGRVILFYTKKNKRVTPAIKNQADLLISQWSRPIIKRSASYRDRDLLVADQGTSSDARRVPKLAQILQQSKAESASRTRKNAVRIPEKSLASFTVVPRNNIGVNGAGGVAGQVDLERRRAQQERLRKMQRKLEFNRQKMARM